MTFPEPHRRAIVVAIVVAIVADGEVGKDRADRLEVSRPGKNR